MNSKADRETGSGSRLEQMAGRLKASGYRMTPQRLALLRIFAESREHPTAEEAYRRLKSDFAMMSLATVYKTVALLKDMGELLELETGNGGRRFDGRNPDPHPHLICNGCEKVIDLESGSLKRMSGKVACETGFVITGHNLIFHGLCPECQARA